MRNLWIGCLVGLLALSLTSACRTGGSHSRTGRAFATTGGGDLRADVPYIDAHNHLFGGRQGQDVDAAARRALEKMSALGIPRMIVMPPPRVAGQHGAADVYDLLGVTKKWPRKLACLGGGGTLNVMIHQYGVRVEVDAEVMARFREQVRDILDRGAVGLGEFSVLHFSLSKTHPFQSAPADHPLFLLLADLAAEHGVPIDIHMEAVAHDMPLPRRRILTRSGKNPDQLAENIAAFERLLAHNRGARIIWAHVGWCNTGHRSAALCRRLLARHANLYMSVKLSPESVPEVGMLTADGMSIRPEWLALMRDYPDRFFIGTDQFYTAPGGRRIGPQKTEDTRRFMNLLPVDLAAKVGVENPRRLFGLDPGR